MKKLNLVIVYNENKDKILMCKRAKEPYKGLYNLVGGKVEEGEVDLCAAYRELEEETGITSKDIVLYHMMDFMYYVNDTELQVYLGTLNKEVELVKEVNELYWIDKNEDFFSKEKFAGEGNIGHMLEQVEKFKENVWKE